jgi:hypothetical protein
MDKTINYHKEDNIMDRKADEMIKKAHDKFMSNIFSEEDVKSFFMDIREHINNPIIKEICHFFAHRKRDKGIVSDYIKDKHDFFSGVKIGKMEIKSVISTDLLFKQINNDVFETMGLSKLSRRTINDILLYIIVILQEVAIYDKNNKQIGTLHIDFILNDIFLNASLPFIRKSDGAPFNIVFPVIKVDNFYTQTKFTYKGMESDVFIDLKCNNNTIQIFNNGVLL